MKLMWINEIVEPPIRSITWCQQPIHTIKHALLRRPSGRPFRTQLQSQTYIDTNSHPQTFHSAFTTPDPHAYYALSITVPMKGSGGSESCKSAESWREWDEAMSMFMSTISDITSH